METSIRRASWRVARRSPVRTGLKNLLLADSEQFVRGTVEKLMTYALGRELDARDQPTIRAIMRDTEANRYRFWDLIIAIVKSVPFEMRQTQAR